MGKLKNEEKLTLKIKAAKKSDSAFFPIISKLTNLSSIEYIPEKIGNSISFLVGRNEYFIPLANQINVEEEQSKIKEEIKYHKGFLKSVEKKLANERFVNNAPAKVVEVEKRKHADAIAKINILENQLAMLGPI